MNKRARLARRILRDHRRDVFLHTARDFRRPALEVYRFWGCTHCEYPELNYYPEAVPRAYR
jgi:hypothetical protein